MVLALLFRIYKDQKYIKTNIKMKYSVTIALFLSVAQAGDGGGESRNACHTSNTGAWDPEVNTR